MKKLLAVLFATALIYSCGSNEGETKQEEPKQEDPAAAQSTQGGGSETASSDRGLELIGSSDCTACHAIDRKIIGPAYQDVADKYENTEANIDSLVAKVKNGGAGNWGTVPMTPHPDLPDADAREMVKYILSLRKK